LIYSDAAFASLGSTLDKDFSQCSGQGKALLSCYSRALSICGTAFSKQTSLQKTGALLKQAAANMRGASTLNDGIHVLANLRSAVANTGELNVEQIASLRAALANGIAALRAAGG
jgi:hypothetical protein